MITGLANIIADFFVSRQWVEADERDTYQYGCEVILASLVNVIIVVLCGLLFHELAYISAFYLVFLLLRRYCGGYHAKTHLKCNTIFTANIVFVLLILKNYNFVSSRFVFLAVFVSCLVVWILSPIINKNKPLTEEEANKYRKISFIISLVVAVTALMLVAVNMKISVMLSMALLSVSGAMMVEKIVRREV